MKSVWLCPSRSRPANVVRLIDAFNVCGARADLVIALDSDDEHLTEYHDAIATTTANGWGLHVITGPRRRLGPTLNHLAVQYAETYETVGFLGDDHIPRTPGFDRELHDTVTVQGGGLAYGNDLLQGENLATAVLQDARLIRTLGQFNPPEQTHLYLDNYWMDLGRALGKLAYRGDVVIEHAHFIAGKAPVDELYAEVNAHSMYELDQLAYERYRADQFADDIAKAKAAYDG